LAPSASVASFIPAREEIRKHLRHRGFPRRPVLLRHEIDVEVAGKEVVELAARNHAVRSLGDGVVVGPVIARNDAGRHLDRIEIVLARADHGKLRASWNCSRQRSMAAMRCPSDLTLFMARRPPGESASHAPCVPSTS
jgi:hypothetical protein